MSSSEAAASLSNPSQRGTLSLAFRRSVVALQSTFGWPGSAERAEREHFDENGVQSYGSVMDLPPERRVPRPRPVKSAVRVEAKVWFANERTWISWLRVSVLLGSFALALFNSAAFFNHNHSDVPGQEPGPTLPRGPNPDTIKTFGIVYAVISVATLAWGLYSYQRRVTLIKNKWAGDFDDLIGPPVICVALFAAVLINFIVRVQQFNAL